MDTPTRAACDANAAHDAAEWLAQEPPGEERVGVPSDRRIQGLIVRR